MLDAAEQEVQDFGERGILPPKVFDTLYSMVKHFKYMPSEVSNGPLFLGWKFTVVASS